MAILIGNREVHRSVVLIVATFLVLYLTSTYDYLLFHSLAEIFSILIGCGIFLIAYNVRQFLRNNYFLFIGVAYFFVAGLDLVHMFAYKGMGIFSSHDANLPTQLWIAARYLQSISLLVAPLFIGRKPGVFVLIAIFSAIFSFLLLSIFYLRIFPACYVEGSGLTTFKIVSEYTICLILSGALIFVLARKEEFDAQVLRLIIGSIVVTIFSELSFTLYISVYGFANFLGHFLKIVAFYLLYRALIEIGLRMPYRLLFRELASEKEALRKSEAEYRNLVDNLNDIIFKIDAEGKLTYVSKPVTSVLGYEPQELVNRYFASFIHPEDATRFSEGIQHCLEERIYQNEFRICTKQGEYRRVTTSSRATMEHGKAVGVQGIVTDITDITERKRAEEELKQSEARLVRSQAIAHLGSWELDLVNDILTWSDEVYRIFGLQPQEFKATYGAFLEAVHPDDRAAVDEAYSSSLREERDTYEIVHRVIRRSNSEVRTVHERCDHIRDKSGRIVRSIGMVHDITERKKAEDKLRESEERNRFLAGVVESALQPFAVGHVDGTISTFNKAYCDLVGYTEAELRHMDWFQNLTPPEYRDFESAKLAELRATKTPVRYEKEYIRKDGTRVPVELLVHLTTNSKGEPVFYSFITDLTDHKRVEAAIRALNQELEQRVLERTAELADSNEKLKAEVEERRQAEQKFRSIFENSLDGLLFLSPSDGSILLANSAACALFGYSEPDLLKLSRDSIFAPELDGFEREKQSRSFRGELNCMRRDGTTFPAEISSAIFHDAAGEERSCVVIRDITQRKKSEEALLKWGQVFEHAQWGIVVSSDDKKSLAFMNPEFAKMHGYTLEELTGRPILDVFAPDERSGLADHIAIANEKGHHIWESKHIRKNGTVFPVLIDATAVKDETGEVLYRVVNVQDITERKHAENMLRRTLDDLSRSNADLQQFAYVASHDLQEPLRNVATCLQMLEKKYKHQLGEDADRYIRFAVDGAVRMKALIQDLLTYSRVATGEKISEHIECGQILDQTLENLRSTIIETSAEITHDPLPTIAADPTQLLQVFQNLIANAMKFRGGKRPHIHVSAERNAHGWVFSIRDNGIGIASRHVDRIFVIFQRLNKRSEYDGTGMGLAIVKKIIERHGGKVWVESEVGEGSTFYFTIPHSTRAERAQKFR
ncbi:PAS domain S-box protein [Desulfomonile tiedjei]|uniref:histidine kinase n=1 Tax=Desulfomonile tiedjei (strain ATCC 49306 / DSM 6799 / DCB-1) TaxID=706587 RepID=I4C8F3_DESTA|nr:PAS domain S-box protein [Desulfomonile tiedjei]AFM25844.1 PAS domain S-box [Desulfomonile tiedjei DSM 6799]